MVSKNVTIVTITLSTTVTMVTLFLKLSPNIRDICLKRFAGTLKAQIVLPAFSALKQGKDS
jgi:hypothetical protein